MRVIYGRERGKTARRATVDISPEFGTTSTGRRSGRAPCCLHNNCRCNELCAIALRHPQMSPFPVSIERRDLIRTTHKLHRLSNITSAATAPAAADAPSMPQEWSFTAAKRPVISRYPPAFRTSARSMYSMHCRPKGCRRMPRWNSAINARGSLRA